MTLTVKKMVETYIESCCDEIVWRSFRELTNFDVIEWKMWCEFYDKCKDLYYNDEDNTVRRMGDDSIVREWK